MEQIPDSTYLVYLARPGHADMEYHPAGRFDIHNGQLHILEDYHGLLGHLPVGPVTEDTLKKIERMRRSSSVKVVTQDEVDKGEHPELIPEQELGEPVRGDPTAEGQSVNVFPGNRLVQMPVRPASVFEYTRVGMSQPHILEFSNGTGLLNGFRLDPEELHRIHENVLKGAATLRYKNSVSNVTDQIQKMEGAFKDLAKGVEEFEHIRPKVERSKKHSMTDRQLVQSGHLSPEEYKERTADRWKDSMIPSIGNVAAFVDFADRPRQGVHIRLDGNDFGSINKTHSYAHGNKAIIAMGNALRSAMDKTVTHKNGKLFRLATGDEFHAFVPDYHSAARFTRALREELERVPPVGGTHKLSMSVGFGHDTDSAESALHHAKQAKKAVGAPMGMAKTHAHSLVPGHEGPVPMEQEQLPLKNPKVEAPLAPVPSQTPNTPSLAPVKT